MDRLNVLSLLGLSLRGGRLAIGKEGQNARLAARLTGYKIDIKPESYHDEEEPAEDAADGGAEEAVPADAE